MQRSRTTVEFKGKDGPDDKKTKGESSSRDINEKLAALNDNWNSIKRDKELETIKEVRPAGTGKESIDKKPSSAGIFL